MAVMIDIPGVGNVEAKNAASEATLREILAVMKANNKSLTGLGKGKGDTSGSKDIDANNAAQRRGAGLAEKFGKSLGVAAEGTKRVISGFGNLATSTTNLMSAMANVGDGVENAAGVVSQIASKLGPVGSALGSVFTAVASAATKSVGAFQQATASGATFGGSVNQFAKSASAAGMTLTEFAGLIAANGEAFRLLGGNTAEGAKRFATLTKELRSSGATRELNNLGYSTKDVNQGMANYMKYLGQTGKMGNKTNAELASGSAKYLKEMDLLAKVTGETRADQEAARAKLLNDAQFQAKVSSMSAEAGEAFANTVNGLPPGLRDVAKDIMVTGTATTEEAQKFSALMPKSAQMMQKFAAITESGGTITKEMQQQLQNTMAEEGKAQKANFKTQGQYNKEMAGSYMNIVQAANIQRDALKGAAKAQAEAKETTDEQAYQLEKSKQALAEFSNGMTMALANSGLLSTLMTVFGALATFVQSVVVPIFQTLAPVISSLATTAADILTPVFQFLGNVLQKVVLPVFFTISDFIQDNLVPGLLVLGTVVAVTLIPALIAQAAAVIATVAPLLLLAAPVIAVVAGLGLLVTGFKQMGGSVEMITDGLKYFATGISSLLSFLKLGFATLINKLSFGALGGELMEEAGAELKAQTEEREALEKKMSSEMQANRDKAAADDAKKAKEREDRDKKYAQAKFGAEKKAIDDKTKAESAAKTTEIDYTSPEAMLKGFATQQGSPLAKAESVKADLKPPTATAGAEGTKKTIVAEAEAKKAEAQKKAEAATADKTGKPKTAATSTEKATTQETAESLLSTLNTHMAELVRISKANNRISEKQLSVQEGLGGDLFSNAAA